MDKKRILILTVGGSCSPIVSSIKEYKPDYIFFVASDGEKGSVTSINGEGDPCGDPRQTTCPECGKTHPIGNPVGRSIIDQLGLKPGSDFEIILLDEADSLSHCYHRLAGKIPEITERFANADFFADYTGGTKSMSVALAMVAIENKFRLSVVRGTRVDLQKILDGSQIVSRVNAELVFADRRIEEAMELFNRFEYHAASQILQETASNVSLSLELQKNIREYIAICRGFDAWDKFDHAKAESLLKPYRDKFVANWIVLDNIMKEQSASIHLVYDLLLNAERKASLGLYDDASGRLYRALELIAQTRLASRKQPIDTAKVDPELIPEQEREALFNNLQADANGHYKIGLAKAYRLLEILKDPIGSLFTGQTLNLLTIRNRSILAHGFQPVTEEDNSLLAEEVSTFLRKTVNEMGERIGFPQFPISRGGKFHQR